MKFLFSWIGLLLFAPLPATVLASELYVSPGGSDSNSGSADQPLATLAGARDALRARRAAGQVPSGGVTVYLASGYYNQPVTAPLVASGAPPATAASTALSAAAPTQIQLETSLDVVHDVGRNGTVGVSQGTLDSGASVRMYDPGDAVAVTVTVPSDGAYQISLRARSGGSTGSMVFWPGGYTAQVDGTAVALTGDPSSVSAFDAAYGGCYWGTLSSGMLTLAAGNHSVVVTSQLAWAVVDYLEVDSLVAP